MPDGKWSALGTLATISPPGSGTAVNSLPSTSASGFMTYDNSTNRHQYASVHITSTTFTSTGAEPSIRLRAYVVHNAKVPTDLAAHPGGETYVIPVPIGAGAKEANCPLVRLYPESMRFQLINDAGAALGSTVTVSLVPYNDSSA